MLHLQDKITQLNDVRRKINWKETIGYTFLPLLLPFVFDIPDDIGVLGAWGKAILFVAGVIFDFYLVIQHQIRHNEIKTSSWGDEVARRAYSKAYSLMEKKKGYMVDKSYDKTFSIPRKTIPYDVHGYLRVICGEFKNVFSEITDIRSEYLSVALIYRYVYPNVNQEDGSWRWIMGKESATSASLDEYIKDKETAFYLLINGSEENGKTIKHASIFENDKRFLKDSGHYRMSTRDGQHNNIGSIFGAKFVFGNNAENFVESILVVSSYGKQFVENTDGSTDAQKARADSLKIIVIEEILPYYQRLIETELGMLYLGHIAQ